MLKVNYNLCDQCGACISVCPSDALYLTDTLHINHDLCCRCQKCIKICPFSALSLDKAIFHEE